MAIDDLSLREEMEHLCFIEWRKNMEDENSEKSSINVQYPKRTKYSKYRKGRCSRGCKSDGTQLGFERYGTTSCRAGWLAYRGIEAARRTIIGHFHRAMSG
ncbi:hypothetical protein H5410_024839 [Solanum commersonii]|uniref:Uncharacterized protein n=1 Tax=Solanum commersonii TaxID=4109 RepID=A0A9J5ZN37_SOLCO|nr:hypothetical protein H5410_024839 [Solanum commersonii]